MRLDHIEPSLDTVYRHYFEGQHSIEGQHGAA
jgi:hypothetical protein